MSGQGPTVGGTQGAMIYLAESLAGLKLEQAETNHLLRELIALVSAGAQAQPEPEAEQERDVVADLSKLITPVPPATK